MKTCSLLLTLATLFATACTTGPVAGQPAGATPSTPAAAPSAEPSANPSAAPAVSPSASPTPAAPTVTNWNGTLRRVDGRQAGVTLRLVDVIQPNGTIALQGEWTLRGDVNETTPVNGYRRGTDWALLTHVNGVLISFSATLTNRHLQGDYISPQTGEKQGSLDLTQR
jgi:hypothetical protein